MTRGVPIDLTGETFGDWTVLKERRKRGPRGEVLWVCQCSCGATGEVPTGNLRAGLSQRCNACRAKRMGERKRTHGATNDKSRQSLYRLWLKYKTDFAPEWQDFLIFEKDVQPRTAKCVDRPDNTKPFGPDNFRWARGFPKAGVFETVAGTTLKLSDWAAALGLSRERVRQMVASHGTLQAALERRAKRMGVTVQEVVKSHSKHDWRTLMNEGYPRKTKYPWAEWTNGETWTVNATDYGATPDNLKAAIAHHAKYYGLTYKTRSDWDDKNVVHFRFERN